MKRYAPALALLALALAGCGGAASVDDDSSRMTEAGIELERPVKVAKVLKWAREHGIRPTELNFEYEFKTETISGGYAVRPGVSDAEAARDYEQESAGIFEDVDSELATDAELTPEQRANLAEVRRRASLGPAPVVRLTVRGPAGTLHALEEDPLVRSVFVRP